jgi:sulfur-oxidizing protein SoxZ
VSEVRARVIVPPRVKRGETFEVRVLIQHGMETGYRRDLEGRRVTRNILHSLVCRYNGVEVFRATMSSGTAANPYLRFFTRATESGELAFWWIDDNDATGSASARIEVAA